MTSRLRLSGSVMNSPRSTQIQPYSPIHLVPLQISSWPPASTASAAGRLVVNVLGAVSQWEREAIGERTSAAIKYKKSRGEYTGGYVPMGKRVEDGKLVDDEDQARAKDRALDLHANGLSLRKIAAALNAEGYRHPKGEWTFGMVSRLVA